MVFLRNILSVERSIVTANALAFKIAVFYIFWNYVQMFYYVEGLSVKGVRLYNDTLSQISGESIKLTLNKKETD